MLMLAAAALLMPAIFELVEGRGLPKPSAEAIHYGGSVEHLSLAVAIVLIATYVIGPFFSLKNAPRPLQPRVRGRGQLGLVDADLGDGAGDRRVLVGVMSEVLVGSISRPRTRSASPSSSSV